MSVHADKTQENKPQSVAKTGSKKQSDGESVFEFVDNRPGTIAQRKLYEMANNSMQASQAAQFQNIVNNPATPQLSSIQKKTNPESDRRENKTGLPDTLKLGIENLSGHSMDDVKVHYNSDKPSQLQADAYAQGADIHLASGQEKHLPHEAWHVVQQKQGRVKPTMQMKEKVNINDDEGLEKEADMMGAKAIAQGKLDTDKEELKSLSASGGVANQVTKEAVMPMPHSSDVVQPKFGFEFQTENTFETAVLPGEEEEVDETIPAIEEKELAYHDPASGFKIEGDESDTPVHWDLEFITDAFDTLPEAETALDNAHDVATKIAAKATSKATVGGNTEDITIFRNKEKTGAGEWKRDAAVLVTDSTFKGAVQSSVGVELDKISELIDTVSKPEEKLNETFDRNYRGGVGFDLRNDAVRKPILDRPKFKGFIKIIQLAIKDAQDAYTYSTQQDKNFEEQKSFGYDFSSRRAYDYLGGKGDLISLEPDGPKVTFRAMQRTSFRAVYESLAADEKQLFQHLLTLPSFFESTLKLKETDMVFGGPYLAEVSGVDTRLDNDSPIRSVTMKNGESVRVGSGPTVGNWMASIVSGAETDPTRVPINQQPKQINTDLMSPPPGWVGRDPTKVGEFPTSEEIVSRGVYGMGAYPMDGPKVVFEQRGIRPFVSDGFPPSKDWKKVAQEIFKRNENV